MNHSTNFKHTRLHMGTDELLFVKGIFPHEYFDSLDKFRRKMLSTVIQPWNRFAMTNMKEPKEFGNTSVVRRLKIITTCF
jgi:hypothetical protein